MPACSLPGEEGDLGHSRVASSPLSGQEVEMEFFRIPESLEAEHELIRRELARAVDEGGGDGRGEARIRRLRQEASPARQNRGAGALPRGDPDWRVLEAQARSLGAFTGWARHPC